jgi:hypothetical protein
MSAGRAANGRACAGAAAGCRRWGRGSLPRKPCSARTTAGVRRQQRLIAARSRGGGQARELRAVNAVVKPGRSCAGCVVRVDYSSSNSKQAISKAQTKVSTGTLIIARVNKVRRLCRRMMLCATRVEGQKGSQVFEPSSSWHKLQSRPR